MRHLLAQRSAYCCTGCRVHYPSTGLQEHVSTPYPTGGLLAAEGPKPVAETCHQGYTASTASTASSGTMINTNCSPPPLVAATGKPGSASRTSVNAVGHSFVGLGKPQSVGDYLDLQNPLRRLSSNTVWRTECRVVAIYCDVVQTDADASPRNLGPDLVTKGKGISRAPPHST